MYDLNQISYDYTLEVRNRFKGLHLINRMPEELWLWVSNIVQEAPRDQGHPQEKDVTDVGSIPGLGRSPGGGNGNPLWYLPGESHGQMSLAGYSPWSQKESDMIEVT